MELREMNKFAEFMLKQQVVEMERVLKYKDESFKARVKAAIPYALHGGIYTYRGLPEVWEKNFIVFGFKINIRKVT